jgi:signal transduction histidine kinase
VIRLWPRSLAGQMAVLIALSLFVAQAVNFTLVLRERAQFRLAQATRPVATRVVDALEREAQGRPLTRERGRIRRVGRNAVPPGLERQGEIARELHDQLRELGVEAGRIDTGVRAWTAADDALFGRAGGRRGGAPRGFVNRPTEALLIAIEQPGRGWLSIVVPWDDGGGMRIFWRLFAQTLILYAAILVPVLWAARRLSRPLRDLTHAAERFGPGDNAAPVAVRGPDDIAALVSSFNNLRLRVTAMLEEKDRMLGAIGHDLRTPLAALRVRIESVEDDIDRARMADTIEEMSRTLDDILSLARLGRPSEPPTEVDLAALVDAVVEDFRDLGKDVDFPETDRLPLRLRPALMRRALRNLVENAVKYGRTARVRLDATPNGVAITVADDGPGIPADHLATVFEPFTRLEASRNRNTGGSGLGLTLARAIVRDAGGDITLVNRAGGGLDATITLPRVP